MNKEFKDLKAGDVFRSLGTSNASPFVTVVQNAVGGQYERGVFAVKVSDNQHTQFVWTALGHFRVEVR